MTTRGTKAHMWNTINRGREWAKDLEALSDPEVILLEKWFFDYAVDAREIKDAHGTEYREIARLFARFAGELVRRGL